MKLIVGVFRATLLASTSSQQTGHIVDVVVGKACVMFTPRKQAIGESSPGLYGMLKSGLSKVRQALMPLWSACLRGQHALQLACPAYHR